MAVSASVRMRQIACKPWAAWTEGHLAGQACYKLGKAQLPTATHCKHDTNVTKNHRSLGAASHTLAMPLGCTASLQLRAAPCHPFCHRAQRTQTHRPRTLAALLRRQFQVQQPAMWLAPAGLQHVARPPRSAQPAPSRHTMCDGKWQAWPNPPADPNASKLRFQKGCLRQS
jgi:hypothetical protein